MSNTQLLDIETTLTRLKGDKEFLTMLLQVFLDDLPSKLENLEQAIREQDIQSIARHAHSLKGACATIGAMSLQDSAFVMEKAARDEDLAVITDAFPELAGQADKLKIRLQEEIA